MNTALIAREHNGHAFTFREDGGFDMTKAPKAFGKNLPKSLTASLCEDRVCERHGSKNSVQTPALDEIAAHPVAHLGSPQGPSRPTPGPPPHSLPHDHTIPKH